MSKREEPEEVWQELTHIAAGLKKLAEVAYQLKLSPKDRNQLVKAIETAQETAEDLAESVPHDVQEENDGEAED